MIEIVVNGDARSIPKGFNLLDLLHQLALDPAQVAIEMDRRIVKKPHWPETVLAPGSKLEIVQFVGGG